MSFHGYFDLISCFVGQGSRHALPFLLIFALLEVASASMIGGQTGAIGGGEQDDIRFIWLMQVFLVIPTLDGIAVLVDARVNIDTFHVAGQPGDGPFIPSIEAL